MKGEWIWMPDAPHWHFVPEGTDAAICGEVWRPYGVPPEEGPDYSGLHRHPANCPGCEKALIKKGVIK